MREVSILNIFNMSLWNFEDIKNVKNEDIPDSIHPKILQQPIQWWKTVEFFAVQRVKNLGVLNLLNFKDSRERMRETRDFNCVIEKGTVQIVGRSLFSISNLTLPAVLR